MKQFKFDLTDAPFDELDVLASTLDRLVPNSRTMVMEITQVVTNDERVADALTALFGKKTCSVLDDARVECVRNHKKIQTTEPVAPGKRAPISRWKVVRCDAIKEFEGKELSTQSLNSQLKKSIIPEGTLLKHEQEGLRQVMAAGPDLILVVPD